MSDTNPKHTPTPWFTDGSLIFTRTPRGVRHIAGMQGSDGTEENAAHIVECVNSHAALKARCAELEAACNAVAEAFAVFPSGAIVFSDKPAVRSALEKVAAALGTPLLSSRDGEAEPEYCAHCNRIDVPGYHQSDCPAADDGEAK